MAFSSRKSETGLQGIQTQVRTMVLSLGAVGGACEILRSPGERSRVRKLRSVIIVPPGNHLEDRNRLYITQYSSRWSSGTMAQTSQCVVSCIFEEKLVRK